MCYLAIKEALKTRGCQVNSWFFILLWRIDPFFFLETKGLKPNKQIYNLWTFTLHQTVAEEERRVDSEHYPSPLRREGFHSFIPSFIQMPSCFVFSQQPPLPTLHLVISWVLQTGAQSQVLLTSLLHMNVLQIRVNPGNACRSMMSWGGLMRPLLPSLNSCSHKNLSLGFFPLPKD